tara:strand:+ start:425 stop:799 length:375 start_codon:yes stop_codon:yes gene_type:complete
LPEGVYTSLDIILEHPKPGGTRSLNCLVALSPPKITIGVLSGVINLGSRSLSDLHHPYAISKISDVHVRVKFVFLGRYKVCAIPEKTFFRPLNVSQFPLLLVTLKFPESRTMAISFPIVSKSHD